VQAFSEDSSNMNIENPAHGDALAGLHRDTLAVRAAVERS
jgi:hypothetical protein